MYENDIEHLIEFAENLANLLNRKVAHSIEKGFAIYGNILLIAPLGGGDNVREATISQGTKEEFLDRNVIELDKKELSHKIDLFFYGGVNIVSKDGTESTFISIEQNKDDNFFAKHSVNKY